MSRRHKGLLMLVMGSFLLLGDLALLIYFWKQVRNMIEGPVPMSADELAEVDDLDTLPNQWVTLSYHNAMETGVVFVHKSTARPGRPARTWRTKAILIQLKNRWLLVVVPESHAGTTVEGYLRGPALFHEARDRVEAQFPHHDLMPYDIDDTGPAWSTFAYMDLAASALVLIAGFVLLGIGLSMMSTRPRRRVPDRYELGGLRPASDGKRRRRN